MFADWVQLWGDMGRAHGACGMTVSLWAHLWVDHMLGWAKRWGGVADFSAFKGKGRHKALKGKISKQSFRGGAKGGKKGKTRLRKGKRAEKGWDEVIKGDNQDWQLYKRGFSVWNPCWTKQKGYIDNKKMFDEM